MHKLYNYKILYNHNLVTIVSAPDIISAKRKLRKAFNTEIIINKIQLI